MSDQNEQPTVPVVRFNDVEYPLVKELTYREMVEAERLAGDINQMGTVTMGLMLAYFTLRRADQMIGWDGLLDGAAVIEQVPAPLDGDGEGSEPESTPEPDGLSPTPTLSESTLG